MTGARLHSFGVITIACAVDEFEGYIADARRVSGGAAREAVGSARRVRRGVGKGNKERIAPFGEEAGAALTAYLPARVETRRGSRAAESDDGEPLFVNARGGRLTTRSMARLLKRRL